MKTEKYLKMKMIKQKKRNKIPSFGRCESVSINMMKKIHFYWAIERGKSTTEKVAESSWNDNETKIFFHFPHTQSYTLTSFSHLQSSRQKSFGLNVSLRRSLKHISFLYMCGYVYVESIWHMRVTFAAYEEFLFTFFCAFYFLYDMEHKKLSFCEEKIIFSSSILCVFF